MPAEAADIGFHVHPHMLRHGAGYDPPDQGTDTRLIGRIGSAMPSSSGDSVRYTPNSHRAARKRRVGKVAYFTGTGSQSSGHIQSRYYTGRSRRLQVSPFPLTERLARATRRLRGVRRVSPEDHGGHADYGQTFAICWLCTKCRPARTEAPNVGGATLAVARRQ